MKKGRIYYYVVEEDGRKDGLAYIDCKNIEVVKDFVSCVVDEDPKEVIWFPRWRIVEIAIWEEEEDG